MKKTQARHPRENENPVNKPGILLINLGTPDAPNTKAVRRYLKEFLSDPCVVKLPRPIWLPILYGVILPFRSKSSAKLYEAIWDEEGSPLLIHSQRLADKLQTTLQATHKVALGMRYGNPSIKEALQKLSDCDQITIIPLFPQFSETTTGSIIKKTKHLVKKDSREFHFIHSYANHITYIQALTQHIKKYWATHGKGEHLLISFHGIPERYVQQGDPYLKECQLTAEMLRSSLGLEPDDYTLCFQSRFGKAAWIKPYASRTLINLALNGIENVDVVCPGFSMDCLETIEEIDHEYKELFLASGGKKFHYIPALNESDEQVELMKDLARNSQSFLGKL